MNGSKVADSMSCKRAKELDIASYLESLGHKPVKIVREDYWYLSPLRSEKTSSFKVNRKLNRWYDHGLGKGGNLVDFGILYYHCTVAAFLQILAGNFSFRQPYQQIASPGKAETKVIVLRDIMLSSYRLIHYLSERKIPLAIAEQFCREVRFKINGKTYYAIGFKNDAGGYELRNAFLKLSSSPKAVTTIRNGSDILCVFEGFFDFLSYICLYGQSLVRHSDYLVLNSLAFFEKWFPFMDQYHRVRLFLDRDTSGQNCSRIAMEHSVVYSDESILYKGYNDLNEWLVNRKENTS